MGCVPVPTSVRGTAVRPPGSWSPAVESSRQSTYRRRVAERSRSVSPTFDQDDMVDANPVRSRSRHRCSPHATQSASSDQVPSTFYLRNPSPRRESADIGDVGVTLTSARGALRPPPSRRSHSEMCRPSCRHSVAHRLCKRGRVLVALNASAGCQKHERRAEEQGGSGTEDRY